MVSTKTAMYFLGMSPLVNINFLLISDAVGATPFEGILRSLNYFLQR